MRSLSGWTCAAFVALLLMAVPSVALGAPEANDNIGGAVNLTIPDVLEGTNVDATTVPNEFNSPDDADGGCGGVKVGKTVWYRFVGEGDFVTLSTNLSEFDTLLFVFSVNASNALVPEVCSDDIDAAAGRAQSETAFFAEQDQVYYVQLGGCCGGADSEQGDFFLTLWPPPSNDVQSAAETLPLNTTAEKFTLGALEVRTSGRAARSPVRRAPMGRRSGIASRSRQSAM